MAASLQPFRSPDLSSALALNESVFQSTRRVVGAIVQNIMYSEWLPIILGPHYMEEFQLTVDGRSDYEPELNATILNEFSTAAYRSASWGSVHESVLISFMEYQPITADKFLGLHC